MSSDVLVVIGVGGMGRAIARRLGAGKTVILADFDESTLHASATALSDDGYDVHAQTVDVASTESVASLIHAAQSRGPVRQLAHTAGLSPSQATTEKVLAVDLLGVALIVDAFGEVIGTGGAGVVVASMAGHMVPPLPAEHAHALATAAPKDLLALPFINAIDDPGWAYGIAKQANLLRVQAASRLWGQHNARINSISPGIISTPMGRWSWPLRWAKACGPWLPLRLPNVWEHRRTSPRPRPSCWDPRHRSLPEPTCSSTAG